MTEALLLVILFLVFVNAYQLQRVRERGEWLEGRVHAVQRALEALAPADAMPADANTGIGFEIGTSNSDGFTEWYEHASEEERKR